MTARPVMRAFRPREAIWHNGPRGVRGLTLIELMVALTVFAVLGTLTYRGTNQMFSSSQHIEQELVRWRAINRSFQIIESELFQIAAPQRTEAGDRPPPMSLIQTTDTRELHFLSLAGGGGPERAGFVFHRQQIDWTRQTLSGTEAPERDVLIDEVDDARWLFLVNGGWVDTWPNEAAPDEDLPAAIGLELVLPQIGTVSRIYALR